MNSSIRNVRHTFSVANIVSLVVFALSLTDAVAQLIPDDRKIDWDAGIPCGIPNRNKTNIVVTSPPYGAVGDGIKDDTSALQAAFDACASNQVVFIPQGTYRVSRSLSITAKCITIRGAGPGKTIIDSFCSNGVGVLSFGPPKYIHQGPFANVLSGATKGSTTITVSSTSGNVVGGYMTFDQTNDPTFVTNIGSEGPANWVSRENGKRAMGQIVEVTSISGNTVTFQPPLYSSYSQALAPQICSFSGGAKLSGIEDLTVRGNNTGSRQHFRMEGASYCWLKNVESEFADGDHVDIFNSFRCEVRDSYFHDAFSHTSGLTDADLMLASKTTACLIENNVFWRLHASIMLNWGAAGNVIAYNYSANNFDQYSSNAVMADICMHGAHPMFNLFEGNYAVKFSPDSIWGSSSHGTVFRNVFTGTTTVTPPLTGRATLGSPSWWAYQRARTMQIERDSCYYNIIGNVLGSSALTSLMYRAKYVGAPPSTEEYETPYVYLIGYGSVGSSNVSSHTIDTTLIHANWDCVTRSQVLLAGYPSNLPCSLFRQERPSWFNDCPWPPFDSNKPDLSSPTNLPAARRFLALQHESFSLPMPRFSQSISPQQSVIVRDGIGSSVDSHGKILPAAGATAFGHYTYALATKVVVGDDFTVSNVVCRLRRAGNPTFNIRCSVYSQHSQTNAPDMLIGPESAPVQAISIDSLACNVVFSNMCARLTKGSTVWFVLRASALSSPSYVEWMNRSSGYDATGTVLRDAGNSNWSTVAFSLSSIFTPGGALRIPSGPKQIVRQ
jgi:hypothetical protein